MQSNFFRYHFGLEWEKRKFVRRVHAKRILQTAPHTDVPSINRCIKSSSALSDGSDDDQVLKLSSLFMRQTVLYFQCTAS